MENALFNDGFEGWSLKSPSFARHTIDGQAAKRRKKYLVAIIETHGAENGRHFKSCKKSVSTGNFPLCHILWYIWQEGAEKTPIFPLEARVSLLRTSLILGKKRRPNFPKNKAWISLKFRNQFRSTSNDYWRFPHRLPSAVRMMIVRE